MRGGIAASSGMIEEKTLGKRVIKKSNKYSPPSSGHHEQQ